MHKMLKIGRIYRGVIQKIIDIGIFIRVEVGGSGRERRGDPRFCEGLVHVSQIRYGR